MKSRLTNRFPSAIMGFDFLLNMAIRLIKKGYIVTQKNREGIIRDGVFIPYDFSLHEVVDKSRNLILEKGKYNISLRRPNQLEQNDPVGMLIVDNTRNSYDKFWESEEIISKYLCEMRIKFFNDIFIICRKYLMGKIIDVGCGSGNFLKIIEENNLGCEIHGFDFSISGIRRCKKIISKGEFLDGNIYEMQYRVNAFDVVFCIEVLEHLEKPDIAFKELVRICKKNGFIIITIPNGAYDDYIGHLNFWTESEFKNFLSGMSLIDFQYLENKKTMLFIIQK